MSYTLGLEIDTGGPEPHYIENSYWNYTSNCADMWVKAGISFEECKGRTAGYCLPRLQQAVANMREDMDTYRAMNPPNGWSDADKLLARLEELITMWTMHPKATIHVSH